LLSKLVNTLFIGLLILSSFNVYSQNNRDSIRVTRQFPDSTGHLIPDSTLTASLLEKDTIRVTKPSSAVDDPVIYSAKDSMPSDIVKQEIYLYREAKINYQDIELTADYMIVDLATSSIYATSLTDSAGKKTGRPSFKQGDQTFRADTMRYNFKTKKGFIKGVLTEQEGGFLHSETTKRLENENICLSNGKYTTCNADHPHFYIRLREAILTKNKKIYFKKANLYLSDVPTPAWIPFGFLPNNKKFTSGVIFPEYGEEASRGFFLRKGGYYFALSDYFDLSLTGDIYSRGTWGINMHTNYKKRYRYNGSFDARYYVNKYGEKDLASAENPGVYTESTDYSIKWSHRQDPKANPSMNFSANVNLSTTEFDQNHTVSSQNYLTNTKTSSISFETKYPYLHLQKNRLS